jgi:hypothetical protein
MAVWDETKELYVEGRQEIVQGHHKCQTEAQISAGLVK